MNDFIPGDAARTLKNFAKSAADSVSGLVKSEDHPPLMTVEHVDLTKYAGKWFELARLPMTYQSDSQVSTAEYGLNDDGTVSVTNTSYENGEVKHVIEGTASPAEGAEQSNARLSVRFGGVLKLIPEHEEGNYWVIKLDDAYTLALVGTPDRGSLYLLARDTKQAESDMAKEYLDYACKAGFDTSKLIIDDWEKGVGHPVSDATDSSDDTGASSDTAQKPDSIPNDPA